MTGWNMPPGCNENMIPGNRPEDIRYEKLCEEIAGILGNEELSDTTFDRLCEWVVLKLSIAEAEGYKDGMSDAVMDRMYEREGEYK